MDNQSVEQQDIVSHIQDLIVQIRKRAEYEMSLSRAGYIKEPFFILHTTPENLDDITPFNIWQYGYYAGDHWTNPETGERADCPDDSEVTDFSIKGIG